MSLVVENLSLERANETVVDGVSSAIGQSQITAICGPNGAGKSSLLMGLAGLLEAASGKVKLGDAALGSLTPQTRAQRIGYLPQSAEIAWDVSVENIVRLGRLPYGDRGDAAVEAAIAALDLEAFRTRSASQLSGGERARVLLARVLAGEPDWILADEPLAALDLAHQLNLLNHLRGAAHGGAGVILVLHDLAQAMNYADRVLVLDGGKLAADGPPHQALSEAIIAQVWGVNARWIGDNGARALVAS
ncbi:MAG: ATP-binding cassette domain-containing protein [Erythrobacter sp.]